jgi:hypothetical protein
MNEESGVPLLPDESQLHGEAIDAQAYGWLRFNGEEMRKMLSARGLTIEQFAYEYAMQMKRRIPGWYREWEKKNPVQP